MKLNSTFLIALSAFLVLSTSSFGQKKFEKESRISKSDLPSFAVDFAALFTDGQRIKWYLEEGLDRNSIEAKYKRDGRHYSVEFDTLGTMEDVEIPLLTSHSLLNSSIWISPTGWSGKMRFTPITL